MNFDLTDLRLILAVSESESITRGAEKTNISLPAASIRIKNLEQSGRVKLFYRSNQGVKLTPAGETLYYHARLVVERLENLKSDMQEHAKGVKGHIRIFSTITAIAEYLPPLLSQFLSRFSDVDIDLRECPSPEIVRALAEGRIDIGIVAGNIHNDSLESIPFRTDKLVLVVWHGHPLSILERVSYVDITEYEQITLPEGSGMYEFLSKKADEVNKRIKYRIQIGNFETFCRMVEQKVGIGIIPNSSAVRLQKMYDLKIIELEDVWSFRRLQICFRNYEELPGYTKNLIHILTDECWESKIEQI